MVCQGIAVDEELSGGLADDHTVFQVHAQGVDQAGSVCLVVIHQPDDGVVIYFIQVVMVQVSQEMIGNLTQIGSHSLLGIEVGLHIDGN